MERTLQNPFMKSCHSASAVRRYFLNRYVHAPGRWRRSSSVHWPFAHLPTGYSMLSKESARHG